jgi:hypothetical protein
MVNFSTDSPASQSVLMRLVPLRAPILTRILAPILALALTALPVLAQSLPRPEGEVILTVTGAIAQTNADGAAEFDLAMLAELGTVGFSTSTMWTDGVQHFEGVSLRALLDRVGASGTTIRAMALNDYSIDIPIADAVPDGPILAFSVNDEIMSVREKGPLWVVYPYDRDPERYRTEVIHARSVWQLQRLTILP